MEKIEKQVKEIEKEINVVDDVEDVTKEIFIKLQKIIHPHKKKRLTLGQKSADFITKWAGSWFFILGFFVFLGIWIAANVYAWINEWDPYPFILLNLILSCLAAIQAPIILMSQNRQAQRDRIKAEFDYRVNRRAEAEIREIKKQLDKIERMIKR